MRLPFPFTLTLTFTLTSLLLPAAPLFERHDLFEEKTAGFVSYRIPGIVVTTKGTVLVYCEARKNSGADWGEIEIHLRRSTDGGRTFSPALQIAHRGPRVPRHPVALAHRSGQPDEQTVNNPVAIAARDGTVHILYCVEYQRAFHLRSDDDGLTWSAPVEITSAFAPFRTSWNWRTLATGPGHGIELRSGRLLVPVWIALARSSPHGEGAGATIYSDDAGRTWRAGAIAVPNDSVTRSPSECSVAELSDGRVVLHARTRSPADRKAVVVSPDGISRWSAPTFAPDLLEPVCMSGLLAYPNSHDGRTRLLFSNPDTLDPEPHAKKAPGPGDRRVRRNLTVKVSYDDGATWPVARVVEPGPGAYSDLAVLPDGTILCFFESGRGPPAPGARSWPYARLSLARFNLAWLEAR
jgi:sialidase-1